MLKSRFFALVVLTVLILLAACSSNKQVEVVPSEPVLTPIQMARIAVGEGNAAFTEKNYTAAIESFTQAINHFKDAMPTASEADSVAYNVEVLTINIGKAHSDMAVAAYTANNFDLAKSGFESAIATYTSIKPTTITAEEHKNLLIDLYRYLAYSEQKLQNYEAAITNLDKLLALAPGNEEALNIKFSILNDNIKDEVRAYQVLKEYADASQDVSAYINLAKRYQENNRNTEAATYYEKALEIQPDANIMLIVAEFYRSISDWSKSTAMFEKLLGTKPDQARTAAIYRRIGENYSQAGNNAKMLEFFEKYLAIERDDKIALLLASNYNTAKNYNKVVTYASMVIGIDARNNDAIMLRGMAYYNLKRMNEAKADFVKLENDSKYGVNAKKFLSAIK